MLSSIKESIKNLPTKSFGEFYQDYVRDSQDSILYRNVDFASRKCTSLEDIKSVEAGLNKIAEEMKFL